MLTPEQFADEVGRRVVQLASDQAATQGARLSKRDRDTLRTGAIMAAPVTFSLIREEFLRAQAAGCPRGCGANDPCSDPWHDKEADRG